MNFFVRPKTIKKVNKKVAYEKDIVEFVRQDKLVKVKVDEKGNPDETDFLVEEGVIEKSRVNRQDYINSFREDVGIANILKKVALSGDVSLLNQIKRTPLPLGDDGKEIVQDITPLQEGEEAVAQMGDQMRKIYAAIPDELKAGRSLAEFLETCSQAEIDAFVSGQVAKANGGAKDGE